MRYLYSIGIGCYALGAKAAALFNLKARQLIRGWKTTFGRLTMSPVGKGKTAWFHASSLGEFEQARPVLEAFRQQHPDYKVCVTFFSPSGFEVRKGYGQADFVCYLPPDTRANAVRFVNLLQPTVVFFAKYDFWFNYLEQLYRRGIPTYIFSSIFRPNQYFFAWYGGWFRGHLQRCFTHLFVQNDESLRLLKAHGIEQCSVAGDTRFDRVSAIASESRRFDEVEAFCARHAGRKVLVAGSTWAPDERRLAAALEQHPKDWLLVLAPHVISESHLALIENDIFRHERCTRYSQIESADPASRVLVIDNIGMLAHLYRYADAAYIGGGFGVGIHNVLEAVVFGKPVVFGPRYRRFKEACDLVASGGAEALSAAPGALEPVLHRLLDDDDARRKASDACLRYMADNIGSTQTILSIVNRHPAI